MNAAKTTKKINKKTKRLAQHYRCAACKKEFPKTEIQVDHIEPVVLDKFTTWDEFIERLFCNSDNLQAICLICHKRKTKKEAKNAD